MVVGLLCGMDFDDFFGHLNVFLFQEKEMVMNDKLI